MDAFKQALVDLGRRSRGRRSGGIVRLPIDRAFSVRGFGTVVTGTLLSGRVRVDDELVLLPGQRRVKVRGVQVHGAAADEAVRRDSGRPSISAGSIWTRSGAAIRS